MSLPLAHATQLRLCVLLSDEQVQALLLAVNKAGAVVKSASTRRSYTSADSCVLRLDECLRELGSESESVNEVVFGLHPDWVAGNSIASVKEPLLHKMATDLSLQAVGFVVTTEAVLEQELIQHPTFSGTICVVGSTSLFLLLSVQGSVIGVDQVGRSGSIATDMAEAIARLAGHLDPGSRFPDHLVFASLDLSDSQLQSFEQDCLQLDWSKVDALGKMPVIRSITQEEYAAIVGVGAGRATDLPTVTATVASVPAPLPTTDILAASEGFTEIAVETQQNDISSDSGDGKQTGEPVATSFGIPISSDKLLTKPESKKAQELLAELDSMPHPKKRKFTHKHGIILGVLGGIVTLLFAYVIAALFFSSAVITVSPALELVSEEVEITLDPALSETDPAKRALAATSVKKTVTGTDDILTSGVEIVGEKAKGTVTIFNKVTAEKSLPAGTAFKSGSLEFTLDQDVSLASASSKESSGETVIKHSETAATVTAKTIGADGNLAKAAKFTIGDFATSTYEAEAKEAFTGGASREVRVVADTDKKTLLDDLTVQLIKQATEELTSETPEGVYLIPPTGYTVTATKFDAETKTEAERLSLTLSVEIQTLSYTAADLRPIAQEVLSTKLADGYKLSDADPQILSTPESSESTASTSASLLKIAAQVTSHAEPIFDQQALIESLIRKPIAEAQKVLQNDKRISTSSITIEPALFSPLIRSIPNDADRVKLTITQD